MTLEGKAAIVTGSSSGVGAATALRLAEQGCHVVVNYSRSAEAAEAVAAEVRKRGVKALCICADVSDDAAVRAMVQRAGEEFGRLDVLVNNAGTTKFVAHENLDDITMEDFQRIMAVNVMGPLQCTRAARSLLSASGEGAVVNVGSIAGLRGTGSSIAYCASKAALHNLTVTLARVMAPRVRVNAIAPGFIAGAWLQAGLGAAYDAVKGQQESRAVLGRVCEPDDVAEAIMAMVTGNRLVTGHVVPVEGGVMLAI